MEFKLLSRTLLFAVILVSTVDCDSFERPVWGYRCLNRVCQKTAVTSENERSLVGLQTCRFNCGSNFGTIWPHPTGPNFISSTVEQLNADDIQINSNVNIDWMIWGGATTRFRQMVQRKKPTFMPERGGRRLLIRANMDTADLILTMDTAENYNLNTRVDGDSVVVDISAPNYFGIRHGMETLIQLIMYDDFDNKMKIFTNIAITDSPRFKHRGVMLDTSRNFITRAAIERTIDGLAMMKMNTFHWHITDSHSFPLVVESQPDLSKYGAYSREKVYSPRDVREIVEYGLIRGVRIIPEIDAPAHVGEGWERKGVITCFNYQPWDKFCVEPPCGQFDPSQDKLYDMLEDVYREIVGNFGNSFDIFHMGGDEVSFSCWNTSRSLQEWMINRGWNLDERGFKELWNYFQVNALQRFDKVSKKILPIVLWTSTLTERPYLTEFLDKNRYIIQIWTLGDDPVVKEILREGYKVIVSNYDALYMDCGFAGWVTDGNNWCSPYIGWQKVYDNKMETIAGDYIDQVLGAEAAMWTEQADDENLDSRLWPRVSALAERMWTNPQTSWRLADSRMLMNERWLVQNGIGADRMQPEWCLQNEGECPL